MDRLLPLQEQLQLKPVVNHHWVTWSKESLWGDLILLRAHRRQFFWQIFQKMSLQLSYMNSSRNKLAKQKLSSKDLCLSTSIMLSAASQTSFKRGSLLMKLSSQSWTDTLVELCLTTRSYWDKIAPLVQISLSRICLMTGLIKICTKLSVALVRLYQLVSPLRKTITRVDLVLSLLQAKLQLKTHAKKWTANSCPLKVIMMKRPILLQLAFSCQCKPLFHGPSVSLTNQRPSQICSSRISLLRLMQATPTTKLTYVKFLSPTALSRPVKLMSLVPSASFVSKNQLMLQRLFQILAAAFYSQRHVTSNLSKNRLPHHHSTSCT